MTDVIPAVLPHSFDELSGTLSRLRGLAPWVQIDICDGLFVTERTWPMSPSDRTQFAELVRGDEGLPYWQDFNFEVDLMVHNPEKYISTWIAAGASRALLHIRSRHHFAEFCDAAGDTLEVGLAIDLNAPYARVTEYVHRVAYVQIMGISELGRQGSRLDDRVYALIRRVRSDFPDVTIQIDGGVTLENARALLDAGADRLVSGSAIVRADNPRSVIEAFKKLS